MLHPTKQFNPLCYISLLLLLLLYLLIRYNALLNVINVLVKYYFFIYKKYKFIIPT